MPANTPLLGELACLSAALLWAMSIQLFREAIDRHGARAANLFKCVFAAALLAATVLATGSWRAFSVTSPTDLILVAISGLLGLTLGDTALFSAVARLGAHRGLLLQTLAPVFATAIAIPLGEHLGTAQWVGSGVVLAGVMIVLSRDDGRSGRPAVGGIAAGVALGVLSAFGQGPGVVVAKAGMAALPILPATLLRLAVGAGGLAAVGAVTGTLGRAAAALRDRRGLPRLALASFFGTYLAMLLMMAGIAWAPASIAAVLLATPPVFGLVVESVLEHRLPSARGVLGTAIAIVGVALLVAG
jgi:drug/metabolite transporter (DMT)-like permease